MPKVAEAKSIPTLVQRLLELAPLVDDALSASIKNASLKSKKQDGKLSGSVGELCTELKEAPARLTALLNPEPVKNQFVQQQKVKEDAKDKYKDEKALCEELIRAAVAKLTQSRRLLGLSLGEEDQEVYEHELSGEALNALVAAYKTDTKADGVWGGEMEAHIGATQLGFRCDIYVIVDNRVKRQATVGGPNAPVVAFNLLHSGNHYEVLHEAADNKPLHRCRVTPVARDGNCLYNSLLKIHFLRTAVYNKTVQQLRQEVSANLNDEQVKIAVIAIAQSGEVNGLGDKVKEELGKANSPFVAIDSKEYAVLGSGKSLALCGTWTSLVKEKKDYQAHVSTVDRALDDKRLVKTIMERRCGPVATDGTKFAVWSVTRGAEESKKKPSKDAYPVVTALVGKAEYASKGMTSDPNEHAEGFWFGEANARKKSSKENPDPKSALDVLAASKTLLYLECHDSKAPCTDICSPRLYVLSTLLNKPILVFGYSDWGHMLAPQTQKRIQRVLAKAKDNPFNGVAFAKLGPIILFTPKGVFLVGVCDKDSELFFEEEE